MKHSQQCRLGFTLVEVLVVCVLIGVLVTILIVAVGAIRTHAMVTTTQETVNILAEGVEAFKQSTGDYPLAVPDDAWGGETTWDACAAGSPWQTYFVEKSAAPNQDMPDYNWTANPTNIHMLVFQLEQIPDAASIITRIRQTHDTEVQKSVNGAGWDDHDTWCEIAHPLEGEGGYRQVYQAVDAWGTPLRYWTSDTLTWARNDTNHTEWAPEIQTYLTEKLEAANWGFFIEAAGPDKEFGWSDGAPGTFNLDAVEDNVYSIGN